MSGNSSETVCGHGVCSGWEFVCLAEECPLQGAACRSVKSHRFPLPSRSSLPRFSVLLFRVLGLEHAVLAVPKAAWAAQPTVAAHLPAGLRLPAR